MIYLNLKNENTPKMTHAPTPYFARVAFGRRYISQLIVATMNWWNCSSPTAPMSMTLLGGAVTALPSSATLTSTEISRS